jgi:serine/threonine protein kinase
MNIIHRYVKKKNNALKFFFYLSDLKPENILITKATGQVKLGDFGLSKIIDPTQSKKYFLFFINSIRYG